MKAATKVHRGRLIRRVTDGGIGYEKWSWVCTECGREWEIRYVARTCPHQDEARWKRRVLRPLNRNACRASVASARPVASGRA